MSDLRFSLQLIAMSDCNWVGDTNAQDFKQFDYFGRVNKYEILKFVKKCQVISLNKSMFLKLIEENTQTQCEKIEVQKSFIKIEGKSLLANFCNNLFH